MLRNSLLLSVSLLFLQASQALACGACYEDNRAAVYSHTAAQKAANEPEKYDFVVIKVEGPLTNGDQKALSAWLSARQGVDSSTVAVSAMQQSIGFLFEKARGLEKLMNDFGGSFPRHRFRILEYPK